MKVSLKVFISVWAFLILIVAGLFFSAYSRLKPESFVSLVKDQVVKNYPGSSLSVGDVNYSMSVDFTLNMKNLILTRSGKVLVSIGDIEMKIPWWLLLLNRGSAHIILSNLEIFVDHDSEANSNATKVVTGKSNRTIRVVLPGYLSDARYTIKAKNISVRDSVNSRRYFRLSKLLVREFQYGKNSAFELNVPIEITHKGAQFTSELWLFGDLTPEKDLWQINYRGEFRTRDSQEKLQLEDLIIDGKASLNPAQMDIDSALQLLVEKESVGEGSFTANDKKLSIDLKLKKFPLSFLEIIKEEVKNPFLTEISGTSSGILKITKNADHEFAQIKGRLGFDGTINLGDTIVNGKWKLIVDGSKWETSFISPKGEVSFFRRSLIDFSKGSVSQYNEEIGFSGVDLRVASYPFLTLGHLISDPAIIHFNSTVSLKKCLWDKKIIDGEVKYGITPDQRFYQTNLTGEGTSLSMNYQEKNESHQIMIDAKNFPLLDQFKMFDPFLMTKEGRLTGKLEGKWAKEWYDGSWLTNFDFTKLDGATGFFPDFVSTAAKEFNLDATTSVHQIWSVQHRNLLTSITSLTLDGTDPAKISGSLSYTPKFKSYLVLSYPKNRLWKPVRKELAAPIWPAKEEL